MKRESAYAGNGAGLAVALLLVLLSLAGLFDGLNRSFLDWSLRQHASHIQPPDDAVMVLIDEPTIAYMSDTYQQRWPWSRDAFAALFLSLHQAGAKQIVVDLMFLEHSDRMELDDLLGSYATAIDDLILAAPRGDLPIFWRDWEHASGSYLALDSVNRVGHTEYQADPDGVIRHYLWQGSLAQKASDFETNSPSLLLRWYGGIKSLPAQQVLSAQTFMKQGYGSTGLLHQVTHTGRDEYDPQELQQAMQTLPVIAQGVLEGKTVFVGTNIAGAFDVKAVPVSPLEPGVLVHFTAWCNARQDAFIRTFGTSTRSLFSTGLAFLLSLIFVSWGWRRPDVKLLTYLTVLGIASLLSLSYGLLPYFAILPAAPVGSLTLGFVFLTTRNWIMESRRKREVQELFGSYVSPSVVQQLVDHPESLKLTGEKKELSAYFSDLAGFTDMSETMAPEELVELMNIYLSEMSEFILEEQGYLDKYIGDAIMGVFGAPEALENHALSACRAALKSRDHLHELNRRLGIDHGKSLHARIGINTGDMIVGNLGSARKRNYTVVGDAVNLASRLEGANKAFGTTILLGTRTEQLARDQIITRPVELLQVKGKQKPIQTYELICLKANVSDEDLEFSTLFTSAYRFYQQRDFTTALTKFEMAVSMREEDLLSKLYAMRCSEFKLTPPAPNWDGVFVMKGK